MAQRNPYDYNEYLWDWDEDGITADDGHFSPYEEEDDGTPVWTPPHWLIVIVTLLIVASFLGYSLLPLIQYAQQPQPVPAIDSDLLY